VTEYKDASITSCFTLHNMNKEIAADSSNLLLTTSFGIDTISTISSSQTTQKSVKELITMFEKMKTSTSDTSKSLSSSSEVSRSAPTIELLSPLHKNLETITLLWYDPTIVDRKEDTTQTMNELRELVNDYVVFHVNEDECITYIKSIEKEEKLFFVTSGRRATSILNEIHELPQIDSVFIFCYKPEKYQHLLDEFTKIVEIYSDRFCLLESIRENIILVEKQTEIFNFYCHHREKSTRNLSKEAAEFFWFQMYKDIMIQRMASNIHAKQQLLGFCRQYYRGNRKQLEIINEFESDYTSDQAVRWYTKESFIYKLVNKALRTEDIDQLYTFRYFIADLSLSLNRERELLQEKVEVIMVYRGFRLDEEELLNLKANEGNLISINGFFSTSRSRDIAFHFATKSTKRTNAVSIIYEIECNLTEIQSLIFADIAKFSDYPNEQEVLFDVGATFRIISIIEQQEENSHLWIIKMKSAVVDKIIAKEFAEKLKSILHLDDIINDDIMFGLLLAYSERCDESLKYFQKYILNNQNDNREDIGYIYFSIGEVYRLQNDFDKAIENYERALKLMINEKWQHSPFFHMGNIFFKKGDYGKAIYYIGQALSLQQKYYGLDKLSAADTLRCVAVIYYHKKYYLLSLEHFESALRSYETILPIHEHESIAICLTYIGLIYFNVHKMDRALDYFQKSLDVKRSIYPSNHNDIALDLVNIGNVLIEQHQLDSALNFYLDALEIHRQNFNMNNPAATPNTHIEKCLTQIGTVYLRLKEYEAALAFYSMVIKVTEEMFSIEHEYYALTLMNTGHVLYFQNNFDGALKHFLEALYIQEKIFGTKHVDIAKNFDYTGLVYCKLNQFDRALEYYHLSLKMRVDIFPGEENREVAQNLMDIGEVHCAKCEWQNALEYFLRALSIREKIYEILDVHIEIVETLNSLGNVYRQLKQIATSLEYYQKSFQMNVKLPYPEPIARSVIICADLASEIDGQLDSALNIYLGALEFIEAHCKQNCSDDIGTVLYTIGKIYQKTNRLDLALHYYEKTLKLQQTIESPPQDNNIMLTLISIASVLDEQGQLDDAIKYYKQVLIIQEKIYNTNVHIHLAETFELIGHIFEKKHDYTNALKVYDDALEIRQKLMHDDHPEIQRLSEEIVKLKAKMK
jgi:tetratricopeptide (TPR) repeat protein